MTNLQIQSTVHNIISSWGGLQCMHIFRKCILILIVLLQSMLTSFQNSHFTTHTSVKIKNYLGKYMNKIQIIFLDELKASSKELSIKKPNSL